MNIQQASLIPVPSSDISPNHSDDHALWESTAKNDRPRRAQWDDVQQCKGYIKELILQVDSMMHNGLAEVHLTRSHKEVRAAYSVVQEQRGDEFVKSVQCSPYVTSLNGKILKALEQRRMWIRNGNAFIDACGDGLMRWCEAEEAKAREHKCSVCKHRIWLYGFEAAKEGADLLQNARRLSNYVVQARYSLVAHLIRMTDQNVTFYMASMSGRVQYGLPIDAACYPESVVPDESLDRQFIDFGWMKLGRRRQGWLPTSLSVKSYLTEVAEGRLKLQPPSKLRLNSSSDHLSCSSMSSMCDDCKQEDLPSPVDLIAESDQKMVAMSEAGLREEGQRERAQAEGMEIPGANEEGEGESPAGLQVGGDPWTKARRMGAGRAVAISRYLFSFSRDVCLAMMPVWA